MVMNELYFKGEKYISSRRAAQLTGYTKDYVGQLCRGGKVEARLVGRNWYVHEASITEHKKGGRKITTKQLSDYAYEPLTYLREEEGKTLIRKNTAVTYKEDSGISMPAPQKEEEPTTAAVSMRKIPTPVAASSVRGQINVSVNRDVNKNGLKKQYLVSTGHRIHTSVRHPINKSTRTYNFLSPRLLFMGFALFLILFMFSGLVFESNVNYSNVEGGVLDSKIHLRSF